MRLALRYSCSLQQALAGSAFASDSLRIATQAVASLGVFGIQNLHNVSLVKELRTDHLASQQLDHLPMS